MPNYEKDPNYEETPWMKQSETAARMPVNQNPTLQDYRQTPFIVQLKQEPSAKLKGAVC